jgi:hypothetical protein
MGAPPVTDFLTASTHEFRSLRKLTEKSLAQVGDAEFFGSLDPESNSIAIVVKHLAGNMRSRWTDFLTTDGEKPDRDRDSEFELTAADTRAELEQRFARGWETLFATLAALRPEDMAATVMIRGEAHSVTQAILRQVAHYGYHVGQIVLLAKHARGGEWHTLSIPRGGSAAFEARLREWHREGTSDGALRP